MLDIEVGKRLPHYRSFQGIFWQVDKGGIAIYVSHSGPTAKEIRGAKSGQISVGLARVGTHTMFLLLKVEGMMKGWADLPMAWALVEPARRERIARKPHHGLIATMILLDYPSGVVQAVRSFSLSPSFCDALDRLLEEQQASFGTFSFEAHEREIRKRCLTTRPRPFGFMKYSAGRRSAEEEDVGA